MSIDRICKWLLGVAIVSAFWIRGDTDVGGTQALIEPDQIFMLSIGSFVALCFLKIFSQPDRNTV